MLTPGTIIADRYVIVRLLGEGGMGSVYEAKHINIGKRVAIKFLSKDFTNDQEAIERFHQEAQIAGTIGHLNICEVTDFGVTDQGLPYLVMEYLEGESLAEIQSREKTLSVEKALGIMVQVLDALEEVHARGIVHRDLKPENVFLTMVKGHGMVVKLLDFGVSKIMRPADSMRLTKTGTMVGTPYYMSPEQVRNSKDIDLRIDIYACAVILYEMLTGKVPYGGINYSEVVAKILEEPVPDARDTVPDLPADVTGVIKTNMAKAPKKRAESASKLKTELQELLVKYGDGKAAGMPSTKMASLVASGQGEPQARRFSRTLVTAALLSAGILITGSSVLGFLLITGHFKEPQGSSEEDPGEIKTSEIQGFQKKLPPEVPGPGSAQTVTIEITNLPENVRLIHESTVVRGSKLEVPRGNEPITVSILVEGQKPRDIEIVPSSDLIVDGRVSTVKEKKPVEVIKPEPAAATETKKPAVEPKPEKKPDKEKKLKQVWDHYPGVQ